MAYEPSVCIYHGGGCADGFGAAWAIWKRWPTCAFVPGVYGQPLDLEGVDIEGLNILFVDFSAPAADLKALVDEGKAASVVVIDHHKTAAANLADFDLANSAEHLTFILANAAEDVTVWFDMEKSGARMAWDFAHGEESVPEMIALIEDRDLWRFNLLSTRQFAAALRSYPMDFHAWDWINEHVESLVEDGPGILRAHNANVQRLLEDAYTGSIAGHDGVIFLNAPSHYASDAGHELLNRHPEAPFVVTWYRRADGTLNFSVRSENHREDASEIAKLFGGGGHKNAAGFQLSMAGGLGLSVGAV